MSDILDITKYHHDTGDMKNATLFSIVMVACGGFRRGAHFDDKSKKYEPDFQLAMCLIGEYLQRPSWPDEVAALDLSFVGHDDIFKNIYGVEVSGTTRFVRADQPIVTDLVTSSEFLEGSTLVHEVTHVYSCIVNNDCDADHLRKEIWSDESYVYERMLQKRLHPEYKLRCAGD